MPGICLIAGICLGSAWPPRSMALITRHMPGICLALDPSGTMPQVDPKCLEPGYGVSERLPLLHLQVGVDCEGEPLVLDMLPPPVAIAALAFHPCNWEAMHKRAAPVYGTVGEVDAWLQEAEYEDTAEDLGVKSATALLAMSKEALEAKSPRGAELHAALHDPACTLRSSMTRVYGHPFTCDKAIAAQEKVDAKPEQEGERNLNIQLGMGSDKTDISNVEGKWPQHLKLTNIELAHWFDRTSKVIRRRLRAHGEQKHMPGICPQLMLSMFPSLPADPAATPVENAKQRHELYHRCLAVLMIILEECARRGIRVQHKSPPLPLHPTPILCVCQSYAWHMPLQRAWHVAPVAPLLGLPLRPSGAVPNHWGQQGT